MSGPQAVELRQEACGELASATCRYMFRCFTEEDWETVAWYIEDEASCPETVQGELCTDYVVVDPIADGRQIFYGDRVAACVSTIDSAECMSPADFFSHPDHAVACDVTDGTLLEGDECLNSEDCEGKYSVCNINGVCEAGSATDYQRECDLPIEDDECPADTCVSFVENAQGLTGTCTRLCVWDDDCGLNGVCIPYNELGLCLNSCVHDSDCSGGLVCVRDEDEVVGLCTIDVL